jgi:S-DNA-T family DNA segregation ATPase FtsK/SpoIIIE
LYARAQYLTGIGKREWQPSERMPALIILIDEYAELAEQAPGALKDADTIARLGRAPAVTLVAATQRPTQKVMGQGAVRSQMNIRLSFRVEEQRDVDLVLGQGKLRAGWHAHKLNAPGKFLLWSPEHDTPRRARAYLITDADVTDAVARYAPVRPPLDPISRRALAAAPAATPQPADAEDGNDADDRPEDTEDDPEAILRTALSFAPEGGISVPDLVAVTGMSRRWVYYRLRGRASAGQVIQTARGHWRITPETGSNRE